MLRRLIVGVCIGGLALVFYYLDTFYVIEHNFTDRFFREERETDYRIKILAIDEDSLEDVGRWPWPRDVMAEVTSDLADGGAEAVWVDVLYAESSPVEEEDEALEEALATHDEILLPVYFQFDSLQAEAGTALEYRTMFEPIYENYNMDDTGHINVLADEDRVVRQGLLGVESPDGNMIPAISVVLANQLLEEGEQITYDEGGNRWLRGAGEIPTDDWSRMGFSYASSPQQSTFSVYSFKDVLDGTIPPDYFSQSIVLIGPYATGLQDEYLTPMSNTIPMFGVEIHANIIQSLLDEQYYERTSLPVGLLVVGLMFAVPFSIFEAVRARWATGLLFVFLVGYVIFVGVWFDISQMLLPFTYALAAIIFAYVSSVVIQYIQETLEKKRVRDTFGRYVSQNVVDDILDSNEEIKVGGTKKAVTLMFIDIRGFTTLSEKMDPEKVIDILNDYLDLCAQSIFKFEGTIDKFMGDGVMAIYGAPIDQEDHALRAVKTALDIQKQSEALTAKIKEQYDYEIGFGIGINSGECIVGNVGSKDRLDYTAIGDDVNLAARLESKAKAMQILISDKTYEKIKDDVDVTKLEPVMVKGKEKSIQVYQVEKIKGGGAA
ncbi:CHASE2 domain-containing protein [Salisediminibacterium beveridgei]|uniref:Adenylate cyclase n=1 Tax=Salisediminibacterium beveridgei TaxID=632773 RepID=A0A1D7QYA8_9BACI|nr:adenylate/guanylate cyclase domain-containing protein [Salisediminibacterium beveridgei]AOM83996.1 Adenylate cyclase [Salisediminibacterium beveridgei]